MYIHGTNTDSNSFNFLRQKIDHTNIAIEYDAYNDFEENLEELKERFPLQKIMYEGANELPNYTRFMIIGLK